MKSLKTNRIINETRSWFFEYISKIDKSLARWTKKIRLKLPKSESENITTNSTEIKRVLDSTMNSCMPTN